MLGLNLIANVITKIRTLVEQNLRDSTGEDLRDSSSVQLVVNNEE